MKGPCLPRPKKPPSIHKVKIMCSFGGTFVPCEATGKLRYMGGETRIISVDRRGINLSKFLSRVSELCPKLLSCTLRYQLPGAPAQKEDAPLLVPIATDEDVHRMMLDHDRLVVQGKAARLRIFLCSDDSSSSSSGYVGSSALDSSAIGLCSGLQDSNGENGVFGQESSIPNRAAHFSNSTSKVVSGSQIRTTHVPGVGYFRYPYDANLLQQNNMGGNVSGIGSCLTKSGVNGSSGGLVYIDGYNQPVGGVRLPAHVYIHGPLSTLSSVESTNRENVFPLNANFSTAETCLVPISFSNQTNPRVPLLKLYGKNNMLSCNPVCRIKNYRGAGNDGRYHRFGPYGFRTHRSGLHDFEVQRTGGSDGKVHLGKCHPGLRPRSNISKLGQARSLHAHIGTSFDVGNGRGVLRERVLEPNDGKILANHFHGQVGLQAMQFGTSNCHGNWEKCHYSSSSSLRDNINNPIPHFGGIAIEDPLCNTIHVKNVSQSQSSCSNNPFSSPLPYPLRYDASSQYSMNSEHNPHNVNMEQCSVQSTSTANEEPVFSNLYSSSGITRKDAESISRELAYGSVWPQLNVKTQSDLIGAAVCVASNNSLYADIRGIRSFLDVSMLNLSLSSSTEVRPPTPCSSLGSSDVLEDDIRTCDDTNRLTRSEIGLHSNQTEHVDDEPFSSRPLTESLAKETDHNHSNSTSDISIEDAMELQSKSKDSHPSIVTEQSLGTPEDLFYCDKNQDNMMSSSNIKGKANIEESAMICSKIVGETSSKLSSLYSHLVTGELQTIKNSDLEEIRELGSGTYGTVFHGKWKGSDVAIKRLKPSCFAGGETGEDRLVADFWKEAHLLGQLHHPNVVAFYGVVTDMPNLATVTEYMVNGSLKQVLQRNDRTIDRRKRLIIAMDAAFGMEYLHEKNIVHFDLKSHNFLVNMKDPHRPVCKIGDLGLSKVKQRTLVSGGVRGTIPWMAPELLTSKSSMVTEKVDVYSFGIVMWELLTGEEPYEKMRSEEIIAGIIKGNLRPQIPCWCDPAWRSLMERCWSSDPCLRPAFSEIAKELRTIAASMNVK